MSPSQDYYDWLNAGRPWKAALPIATLATTLRQSGYTVYIIGNDDHLKASTPEDHTPFSHTGWPYVNPRWRVCALDIMPKNGDMADLTRIARNIIAAKEVGSASAAFVKYMNFTDEHGNVDHISWQPSENLRSSSDAGHIHLSGRTDFVDSVCADGWNPSAGGILVPPTQTPISYKPIPGPTYEFPLPRGYFFGYNDGTNFSVSGNYGRVFNGRKDSDWLKVWGVQLSNRGWSVGVGRKYLSRYGNDGHYGDEYNALAKAFQADQHLVVDGKIGHDTWTAAFHNPVT